MLSELICEKIEILKRNGKVISFKELDAKEGVKRVWTSCFVEEENVIVRGEYRNTNSSRKVLILLFDGSSKKLRGISVFIGIH